MGYFIGIAFWILLSGCLLTKALPIDDPNVIRLKKHVTCPQDATFYAPKNVKEQCITTALDCVLRELDGQARLDCLDPHGHINDTLEYLDELIEARTKNGYLLTDSWECACEQWPETPFLEFLGHLTTFFQLERSASS